MQVIETRKKVLREEYSNTLNSMANLVYIYKVKNCTYKAIKLIKEVIKLRSKVIRVNYIYIIASINF